MEIKNFIKKYWTDEEANIFRNYKDALFGFVALIIVPGLSIFLTIMTLNLNFWNYTFPMLAISIAGLYDTYGRFNKKSPSKVKLIVRVVLNLSAIILAVISPLLNIYCIEYISPILLLICGLVLFREIIQRVIIRIRIA